jgi:hypothetical protein
MVATLKPHVFLSHVREDAEHVGRLAAALEARGVATWVDRNKIKPGERWQKAIEEAIRSGAFFVACFSQAYAGRDRSYMNEELSIAIEEVRLRPEEASWFIPIRLDDCEIPDRRIGPELGIRSFQRLDMFPDWANSIDSLVEAIGPSSHPGLPTLRVRTGGLRILDPRERPLNPHGRSDQNYTACYVPVTNESSNTIQHCKCIIQYASVKQKSDFKTNTVGPFALAPCEPKNISIGSLQYGYIRTPRGRLRGNLSYRVSITLYGDAQPQTATYKMYVDGGHLVLDRL